MIQRNDVRTILVIDHMVIRFTPREYRIMLYLLKGEAVTDTTLIQEALSGRDDPTLRYNLDKYIDKIRGKLSPFGLSIYRIVKYGYILLATVE